MPALESRRVRTHPLTVTGVPSGASPANTRRTLNPRMSIDRELLRQAGLSSDHDEADHDRQQLISFESDPAVRPGDGSSYPIPAVPMGQMRSPNQAVRPRQAESRPTAKPALCIL